MKVGRHEMTDEQVASVIEQMKSSAGFTTENVWRWTSEVGVHPMAAWSFAKKITQQERKAGNIYQPKHGVWQWKESK